MSTTAAEIHFDDHTLALRAGQPFTVIYSQLVLMRTGVTFTVAVIAFGGAVVPDSFSKYLPDGVV